MIRAATIHVIDPLLTSASSQVFAFAAGAVSTSGPSELRLGVMSTPRRAADYEVKRPHRSMRAAR